MTAHISRRRFIRIVGASAACASAFGAGGAVGAEMRPHLWRGVALGAVATLQLYHENAATAAALIDAVAAEARRLERIFSLYKPDSDLVRLNRSGFLAAPAPELVDLLRRARMLREATQGAFDASVQPLWSLYFDHFSREGADSSGPSQDHVRAALDLVDFSQVRIGADRISMSKGMALTLNGIAQGYITDRVVDILREGGVTRALVDMGEPRTIGDRPDGAPWRVGVANPLDPARSCTELDLADRAIATSGAYGFQFEPTGRFNHIFDPRDGRCAALYRSISVIAADATTADALSTACSLLTQDQIARALRAAHADYALLVDQTASVTRIASG
jgi:FAD:protein FMN transferase